MKSGTGLGFITLEFLMQLTEVEICYGKALRNAVAIVHLYGKEASVHSIYIAFDRSI